MRIDEIDVDAPTLTDPSLPSHSDFSTNLPTYFVYTSC